VRNALARLAQKAPREELARLGISVKSVIRKVLRRARELGMKGLLKRRGLKGSAVKNFLNKQILRKAVSKIRKIKKDFELLKKEAEITKANLENLKVKREKYSKGIKKFANQIKQLKSKAKSLEVTVSSLKKEVEDTKHFYLTNAKKVLERRNELGDFAKDLKDKDLIDDTKYELTKAKKIIAEKEAEKKKIELKTASLIVGDKEKEDQWAKNREIVNQKAFGHLYKKEKKIG
jgi:chromosome segregation ATPase